MLKINNKSVYKVYKNQSIVKKMYKAGNKVFEYKNPNLPQGYTECKYIQTGQGENYINTGFVPNDYGGNYTFVLDFQGVALPSASRYMCGTGSPRSCNIRVNTNGSINVYNETMETSGAAIVVSLSTEEADILNRNKYKIIVRDEQSTILKKGGVEYSQENASRSDSTVSFKIGHTAGTNGYDFKIYNSKIYDGSDALIRNFTPCLDTNNVPCFYDSVTQQTYYNAGTGVFQYELL